MEERREDWRRGERIGGEERGLEERREDWRRGERIGGERTEDWRRSTLTSGGGIACSVGEMGGACMTASGTGEEEEVMAMELREDTGLPRGLPLGMPAEPMELRLRELMLKSCTD